MNYNELMEFMFSQKEQECEGIKRFDYYINDKTKAEYLVVGFGQHSETQEMEVEYVSMETRKKWHRPVSLFKRKFTLKTI